MAIDRADGFGHFTTLADYALKGHTSAGVNVTFAPTGGRGNRGIATISVNSNIRHVLKSAQATIISHYAFNCSARTNTNQIGLFRSATNDNILIEGMEDGSIRVSRCDSLFGQSAFSPLSLTTLGTTAPAQYFAGVWHQIQTKCTVAAGGAGEVTIKLDGAVVLSLTGITTYCGAGGISTSQCGFGTNFGVGTISYSDIVLVNTVDDGSGYTGFLGDVAVYENVSPIDGDELQWTRSTGIGTWSSHVDQNPQTGDAIYLSSPTNGQRNCFSFPNVDSAVGTVLAIKATFCHRKEDAAFGAIKLYSRSNDAVDHDQDTQTCTQSYHFSEAIFPKDLKDNSAWTVAKVNATQLGIVNVS